MIDDVEYIFMSYCLYLGREKKISNIYFEHRSCPGLHYPEFLRLLFCIML